MGIHRSQWALVLMLQLCTLPCSGEAISPADIARAKLVLTGICDGRERLQSGVFHATGYLKSGDMNAISGGPFDQSLRVDGAFDVARRLSRFDYVGPGTSDSINRVGIGLARLDIRFVRTPDKFYRYLGTTSDLEGANSLDVFQPNDPVGPNDWEFDTRLIGVYGFPRIGYPTVESEFQHTVERFVSPERLSMLTAFEILDGGICRLEWLLGKGRVRHVDWVNETNGPLLIRCETYINKGAKADQWPKTPTETTEITWKEINSIWVPETVRFQTAQEPVRDLSLKFDWTQVNEPVSEDLFKPQQLNLSGETRITDVRLGTPIQEGTIGNPNYRPPQPPQAPPTPAWQIAGMILIVIVGVVAAYQMSRRLKSN